MFPGRPPGPRGAPALIRLITVHMAAARARPPLSHGREESPSVRRQNRGRFSRRPAPLRRPLAAASSLSSPGSLRRSSGAGSRTVALRSFPCLPPRLLSPFCPSLPGPSEAFWLSLCSLHLPHARVQRPCSPWVHMGPRLPQPFPSFLPGDPRPTLVLALLSVRRPRMLWAQAMTLAWFGGKLWPLSGGRQLQDSEKLGTCPVLGQGRCGGAPTAGCVCGGAVLSGPMMLSSWCPMARPQRQSNSEAVPALGTATSPSGVGLGEGLGCPCHGPGPASPDNCSSGICWEYMSKGFWAGHRMSPFATLRPKKFIHSLIHSFIHSTNILLSAYYMPETVLGI